jgi:hypothetical protein
MDFSAWTAGGLLMSLADVTGKVERTVFCGVADAQIRAILLTGQETADAGSAETSTNQGILASEG